MVRYRSNCIRERQKNVPNLTKKVKDIINKKRPRGHLNMLLKCRVRGGVIRLAPPRFSFTPLMNEHMHLDGGYPVCIDSMVSAECAAPSRLYGCLCSRRMSAFCPATCNGSCLPNESFLSRNTQAARPAACPQKEFLGVRSDAFRSPVRRLEPKE